jgi:hypothetical protein
MIVNLNISIMFRKKTTAVEDDPCQFNVQTCECDSKRERSPSLFALGESSVTPQPFT